LAIIVVWQLSLFGNCRCLAIVVVWQLSLFGNCRCLAIVVVWQLSLFGNCHRFDERPWLLSYHLLPAALLYLLAFLEHLVHQRLHLGIIPSSDTDPDASFLAHTVRHRHWFT
jgi:hypothetical protein